MKDLGIFVSWGFCWDICVRKEEIWVVMKVGIGNNNRYGLFGNWKRG